MPALIVLEPTAIAWLPSADATEPIASAAAADALALYPIDVVLV